LWIGLWIGIFDLADATPSMSALALVSPIEDCFQLPIVRPESAAGVSTLTSIHTKSLQPQLERCQLRIPQPVRTAGRSCSRTPGVPPASSEQLTAIALSLRDRINLGSTQRFRLVGVGLSNFRDLAQLQSPLFD
jgi:hypothetical protein